MLNRALLLEQLQSVQNGLFIDTSDQLRIAQESWQRILKDPLFIYKVRQISTPWLVPDWYDSLARTIPVESKIGPYSVLAVDGSQVYPDRHQGTPCYLINIGSVTLNYGQTGVNPVFFESRPTVFTGFNGDENVSHGQELVNCRRQEFELQVGLAKSIEFSSKNPTIPFVFLFDGSLVFWHLESKEQNLKDLFLNRYLNLLDALYQSAILCAGYISLPKSKELVNLIRLELCGFQIEGCDKLEAVNHLVDSSIAHFFLPEYSRSIVFKSNAKIGTLYPEHLTPHFFYMNVDSEIVRIEIPAWIALDEKKLDQVASMILNQCIKGRGYPVALAEAHEQAVVKGPDRDFFYHLITKIGIESAQKLTHSQKSLKKRGIGI